MSWNLGLVLLLVGASATEAGVSVSPTRVTFRGRPRQTLKGTFKVTNEGSEAVKVEVAAEDWARGLAGPREPAAWMRIDPKTLTLKSGAHAKVRYTIQVPSDAIGELRAQVFFTTIVTGPAGTFPVHTRVGGIVYVGVAGTEHVAGEIGAVEAQYTKGLPAATKSDQLEVILTVRNLGNVHLIPSGHARVLDAAQRTLATIEFREGWGLLPGEQDVYRATGYGVYLQPGTYTMEVAIIGGSDLQQPTTFTKTLQVRVDDHGHLEVIPPNGSAL